MPVIMGRWLFDNSEVTRVISVNLPMNKGFEKLFSEFSLNAHPNAKIWIVIFFSFFVDDEFYDDDELIIIEHDALSFLSIFIF